MANLAQQMRERTEKALSTIDEEAEILYLGVIEMIGEAAAVGDNKFIWRDGFNYWHGTTKELELHHRIENRLKEDGFDVSSERSGGALRIYW